MDNKNTSFNSIIAANRRREPLTDTNLLLTITICIFVGMYLIGWIFLSRPGFGFRSTQQFVNIFNNNAALIILSCGLSVVMVSGGIDISVGGVTALVTMSCVIFLDGKAAGAVGSFSVVVSILLALGIGIGFGLLHGYLVSYLEIQPFIVTLAGMFLARGLTTMINSNPYTAQNEAFKALKAVKITIGAVNINLGLIISLLVVAAIFVTLKWTRFGRNLYAIGGNSQSALMLGINVKRTRFFAYVLCGLLSGIGGYVWLLKTGSGSVAHADGAEMQAIASSIIGGTLLTGGVGNIIGTLFGVLILQTMDSIVIALRLSDAWWQSITLGAMLCFFILLQSVVLAARAKGKDQKINWFKPRK